MPVEFTCDNCNRRLRAPDAKAGKRVNCPTCGKDLQIPVMSSPAPISLPTAGMPIPNPLDKLAAAIPSAADAASAFKLSKPNPSLTPTPIPTLATTPAPTPNPTSPAAAAAAPKVAPSPQIDIGLADDGLQPVPTAPTSTTPASSSSSGIGGTLKPKPNAWRGAEKPAFPAAAPKPAMPNKPVFPSQPVMPTSPGLSLPMASAVPTAGAAPVAPKPPTAPLAPVVANPLDDIFKDLPQLQPIAPSTAPQFQPTGGAIFGNLKPITAADPFATQGAALPAAAAPRWDQIASSANVGSSNPYAAPAMGASSGYRRGANIESVRTMVMIPGIFLLITYIVMLIFSAAQFGLLLIASLAVLSTQEMRNDAELSIMAQLGLSFVVFILSIAGLFGAIKMIRLRSWSAALTASILAIFPFYYCLPIGIWAVIVLSMENVRNAFEANDRQAERRA